MATLIDSLLVSLKLDDGQFKEKARSAIAENEKLSKSIKKVDDASADAADEVEELGDKTKKTKENTEDLTKSINGAVKALAGLFTAIFASTGLTKLINETAQANDKLNFLSKNLGMNARSIAKWQGASEMAGGSADGMASSLSNLSKSLWDMVTTGDTSVLPYFNALNVGVVDSAGKIRELDDILLDVSDSLTKMERPQAYNIARSMGFDDGTINMLLQGRSEMERQLAAQERIVISSEQELAISRKLNETNSLVSRQWEGLKTLLGNYLMPSFLAFSQKISGWLDYLNQNRDKAISLFKGIAAIIGLTLIPIALTAGKAFLLMFAPLFTGIGLIALLGAGLWALYDDYQVWKRGGDSLFDWSEWDESITYVLKKLDEFKLWFKDTTIGKWFTDQEGNISNWKLALGALALYIGGKWLIGILGAVAKISTAFDGLLGFPKLFSAALSAAGLYVIAGSVDEIYNRTKAAINGEQYGGFKSHSQEMFDRDELLGRENHKINWMAANPGKEYPGYNPEDFMHPNDPRLGIKPKPNNKLDNMDEYFSSLEDRYKLPRGTLKAVALTESSGNPNAIGPDTKYGKAKGLFQFVDSTAAEMGLQGNDVFDPNKASEAAAKYLQWLNIRHNGNWDDTFAAYNWGTGNVAKKGTDNLPKETANYVKKVNGYMAQSNVANNVKSLNNQLSQPFAGAGANQFMAQSQALNSQPSITNNKFDINIGDIVVQTTSSTITGVTSDAIEAARERAYQLVPSMR